MKNMLGMMGMVLLGGCSTGIYPYGTVITAPGETPVSYAAPVYSAPIVPLAPSYYGVGVGYYPVYGFGWGNWGWNNCNWPAGNSGCRTYNGYQGYGWNGYRGWGGSYGGYYRGYSGYGCRH